MNGSINSGNSLEDLSRLIHKQVEYRFHKKQLTFSLSMGLFSSNDVDAGTDLLLRNIVEHVEIARTERLLDAGCGTGVIAVTLKALYPHLDVTATDRDALALSVTQHNARDNGVELRTKPGLDVLPVDPRSYQNNISAGRLPQHSGSFDLIVTNIPAKAGRPVLHRFIINALAMLSPKGRFAFVIVDTLREEAAELIQQSPAVLLKRVDGPRHSVFLLQPKENHVPDTTFPGPYRREKRTFTMQEVTYDLETVYNLPGFDTLPFDAEMLGKASFPVLNEVQNLPGMIITLFNPQQGHELTALLKAAFNRFSVDEKRFQPTVQLMGRDLLALCISAWNLQKAAPYSQITLFHIPCLGAGAKLLDEGSLLPSELMLIRPDSIPRSSWYQQVTDLLSAGTQPADWLITAAKSTLLAPFDKGLQGYRKVDSKKSRGFRYLKYRSLY
ncbi:MAG: class I SAM-dependent methyltransferase [Spirochaetota bacterium]